MRAVTKRLIELRSFRHKVALYLSSLQINDDEIKSESTPSSMIFK